MENRINKALSNKDLLSIYFTAGFPELEDTLPIIQQLDRSGVDMIEIGLPFSDPLADGPTIQASGTQALQNGMSTRKLFEQLENVREHTDLPLIIMGNINPVMQFGVEEFCEECEKIGIDGIILPDLPVYEYELHYKEIFEKYGLINIFLITPQTSEKRVRYIDEISNGFIYMVSDSSITGAKSDISESQRAYFSRINAMKLKNPRIIGFGISNNETFQVATNNSKGAIIGSAFVNFVKERGVSHIPEFIDLVRIPVEQG